MTDSHQTTGLPGWTPSAAAVEAYGPYLSSLSRCATQTLYRLAYDRARIATAAASPTGDTLGEIKHITMELRDDLLETAAVLDLLALCLPPGPYAPHQDDRPQPPYDEELRTDAADLALQLVEHDRLRDTGHSPLPATGDPAADEVRDEARAYVRREWKVSRPA